MPQPSSNHLTSKSENIKTPIVGHGKETCLQNIAIDHDRFTYMHATTFQKQPRRYRSNSWSWKSLENRSQTTAGCKKWMKSSITIATSCFFQHEITAQQNTDLAYRLTFNLLHISVLSAANFCLTERSFMIGLWEDSTWSRNKTTLFAYNTPFYLNLFYKSNRSHFLWVSQRASPLGVSKRVYKSLAFRARHLQAFLVFSQHLPIESVVYCLTETFPQRKFQTLLSFYAYKTCRGYFWFFNTVILQ